MKEEVVRLNNIEVETLFSKIKEHLKEIGLQIIYEDKHENYWSVKAHKGGTLNAVTGSIRDVEIIIAGSKDTFDLTLRTGAWGRDIAIPALLASAVSFGLGAGVAVAEAYRAHKFEKDFWEWITQSVKSFNATMTQPVPAGCNRFCSKCNSPISTDAKFCMHCGAQQS